MADLGDDELDFVGDERRLLEGGSPSAGSPTPRRRPRRLNLGSIPLCFASSIFVMGAFAVMRRGGGRFGDDGALAEHLDSAFVPPGGPELRVSNAYERSRERAIGDGLLAGAYPRLAAVRAPTRLDLGVAVAEWAFAPDVVDVLDATRPTSVDVSFPAVGEYAVSATPSESGDVMTFNVVAKVVRRELRDLDADSRDRYLGALRTLYETSDDAGTRLYGEKYASADFFVRMHLKGAAARECDHWHDDAGILNHHAGITWLFEESLRSVDPSTAAHYWDYTLDGDLGAAWPSAFVFDEAWFGPVDSESRVVSRGTFAYTKVRANAADFSNVTNAFGLLRSPWNTSPTPFLARSSRTLGLAANGYASLPTCAQFADVAATGKLSTVLHAANGQLHGPVHIMVGGHWGVAELDAWAPYLASQQSADYWLLLSKFLWRRGYVRCPAHCSADSEPGDCACACPDLGGLDAEAVLRASGVADLAPPQGGWLEKVARETNFTAEDVLRVLCSVGVPGELFTSAAPQDPLFWPLHGNAERLLMYLRLLGDGGQLPLDETWGYDHARSPSDTGVVCDWAGADAAGARRPTCAEATCAGHDRDDLLPFDDLPGAPLSNAAFYDRTHPAHPDLPFVYADLAHWPACAEASLLDEDFDDAWRYHGPNPA